MRLFKVEMPATLCSALVPGKNLSSSLVQIKVESR